MANRQFFATSESKYNLANPFPQFDVAMALLWLIPAFAIITILLAFANKRNSLVAILAGLLTLVLATVYTLFTNVLTDLGAAHSYGIGLYLAIIAGAGIILASAAGWLIKLAVLIAAPALTYAGFVSMEKYLHNEKFENTANSSSAYTVNAFDLIKEFQANDSAANAKYREKIMTVNGPISEIETPNDSTVNIKFIDSTGSYAIFPFHGEEVTPVKQLQKGQDVSIKGSCSGGVMSEILGTESITFKRCILNKK